MLESDLLLDRRRLKRRLLLWRVLAIGALLGAVLLLVRPAMVGAGRQHIARVNVTGIISDERKLIEAIGRLAADRTVPAVILAIDSPGGSVGGGEALYGALKRVAAAKPLVAVMRGTAASAGYMVALPAARIFARDSTLTGSIGVLLQTGNVSDLLARIGVTAETIVSGPLKDQPSLTQPLTPRGRDYLRGLVMDMYEQFVAKVADARKMGLARVRELADGRAYTGRQALELGLIDAIGGEQEARDWLASERGIDRRTPVRDVQPGSFLERNFSAALGQFWQSVLPPGMMPGMMPGAWAVWQGDSAR